MTAAQPPNNVARDPAGEKKKKKTPRELYEQLWNMRAGVWICACGVLCLSAFIISKHPSGPLLAAAAYNLSAAVVGLFMICGPTLKPISPVNARPPTPFLAALGVSSVLWPAAFGVMFAMPSNDDADEILNMKKRGFGLAISTGGSVPNLLESITIACSCVGVSAFIMCLWEWYYVFRILDGRFSDEELLDAYEQKDKPKETT